MASISSWKRVGLILAAVVLAAGVVACGNDGSDDPGDETGLTEATLVLDFIPGAVHVGIYEAQAAGYYEDNGIRLRIIEPPSTSDALKLVDAGKAEFGLADGIDLAGQVQEGREVKGVMAVLQRPPGGLITRSKDGIETPADLVGKTVGVTGVLSDTATVDTMLAGTGANPADVDVVTIGFNGAQALKAGKIQAFTGYIPADAVQVEEDGVQTRSFPLDENGGPSYPGLVAFAADSTVEDDPDLARGFVEATIKGYQDALDDPEKAIDDLVAQVRFVDRKLATRSLEEWMPLMGGPDKYGQFDQRNLEALSAFMVETGLSPEPVGPDRMATNEFNGGDELTGVSGE